VPKINEATRAARRQDLVDAAWRSIARTGWRDLTVDDVCVEAGVSKGAFYGYFDRKQDLLLALLEDETGRFDQLLVDLKAGEQPASVQLRQLARTMLEHAADPARVQLRADLWAALSAEPQVRDRFAATVAGQRAALRALVDAGVASGELTAVPANALASILLALIDGLVLHGGLDPAAFRWQNIYRAVEAVLDGLRSAHRQEGP
jgi:AcrR family transcriptional regulator